VSLTIELLHRHGENLLRHCSVSGA
jgi:hypothetical protein